VCELGAGRLSGTTIIFQAVANFWAEASSQKEKIYFFLYLLNEKILYRYISLVSYWLLFG